MDSIQQMPEQQQTIIGTDYHVLQLATEVDQKGPKRQQSALTAMATYSLIRNEIEALEN